MMPVGVHLGGKACKPVPDRGSQEPPDRFEEDERQRKLYNRKIIQTTFRSEIRKKKIDMVEFLLDIMIFFVATILAEIVINSANIAFRGAHFLVDFLLVAVLFGGKQIIKNIRK